MYYYNKYGQVLALKEIIFDINGHAFPDHLASFIMTSVVDLIKITEKLRMIKLKIN